MKNMMKRLLTTLVIFALVFTCIPAFSGTLEADAAAKPSPVNSIRLVTSGTSQITVSWGKAKKNYNGYTIYRDGKVLKHVGKSVKSYKDTGLKSGTKYTYYVRAYRNVKQKQWFNKKTGKWQTKKPAKKIRGKSRKVTVKLYGRSSPTQSVKTGIDTSFAGKVKTEDGNIRISWSEYSGATKYVVLRGDGKTFPATTAKSYVDSTVVAGLDYVYKVRALNANNEIMGELEFNAITAKAAPGSEFKIHAKREPGKVSLDWKDYEVVKEYILYRNEKEVWRGKATTFVDEDQMQDDVEYNYHLKKIVGNETKDTVILTVRKLSGSEPIEFVETVTIN